MGDIIQVHALENFEGIEAERWPFHVLLPFIQLNSERYICEETKEIWHRFSNISIYQEDDDYPEGDLIEDMKELSPGLVAWLSKNGASPKTGDIFQVLDDKNNIIFEETIHDTEKLYNVEYATAYKAVPFVLDALDDVKQLVSNMLNEQLKRSFDPEPSLLRVSPKTPADIKTIPFTVRGILFSICIEEFITENDCKLIEYKDGNFDYKDFPKGEHWFELSYYFEKAPDYARSIGWGEGRADEVLSKLKNLQYMNHTESFLSNLIQTASETKQIEHSQNVNKEHAKEFEL